MNYLRRVFGKPIVPLLIINSALNQQKTVTLLKKLRKVDFSNAKAIGMVIEIDNHMPVQIDKIVDFMQQVKQQHKLQLFGFCHSQISPQSYYLLSSADRIYTMPSTLFQLQRGTRQFSTQQLLIKLGVRKTTIKSDQNLTGANIDLFTSANTSKYINQKFTQINNRLFGYAIANRIKNNKDKISDQEPPEIMLGEEAVAKGYVDGVKANISRMPVETCSYKIKVFYSNIVGLDCFSDNNSTFLVESITKIHDNNVFLDEALSRAGMMGQKQCQIFYYIVTGIVNYTTLMINQFFMLVKYQTQSK